MTKPRYISLNGIALWNQYGGIANFYHRLTYSLQEYIEDRLDRDGRELLVLLHQQHLWETLGTCPPLAR